MTRRPGDLQTPEQLCGAVLPVHAEIESETVGYNSMSLESGKWYMVAPQFKKTGSDTDTINLLDVFKVTGVTAVPMANRNNGAQIQIYNPSTGGYTKYYYINNAKSGTETVTAWSSALVAATNIPLELGEGFWLKTGDVEDDATILVQGEVKSDVSKTITVGDSGEWQIISNPYPVDLTFENITTQLTAVPMASRNNGAQIQVYNSATGGYTKYYYINNAKSGSDTVTAWSTALVAATGKLTGVGQAFWIKTPEEGTLTFSFGN